MITGILVSRPILGRIDLMAGLNGTLGGLVAVTAAPDITTHYWAVIIGAIGGALCVAAMKLLEMLKVDDVVGAVPAHLFCGVWGTLAVCIAGGGNFGVQLIGILAVGVFVFGTSLLIWFVLGRTMGARVSASVEAHGQDVGELGMEAYPEFVLLPEED